MFGVNDAETFRADGMRDDVSWDRFEKITALTPTSVIRAYFVTRAARRHHEVKRFSGSTFDE